MEHNNNGSSETNDQNAPGAPSTLALTIDYEKYLSQLEEWDVTEDQKREFISALWYLLLAFAELGFDIHPTQAAQNASLKKLIKPPETQEKTGVSGRDMVCSNPIHRTQTINNNGPTKRPNERSSRHE